MSRPPWESDCDCRPGYKCPSCEQKEKREAKERAERRRVEKMRSEDDDD